MYEENSGKVKQKHMVLDLPLIECPIESVQTKECNATVFWNNLVPMRLSKLRPVDSIILKVTCFLKNMTWCSNAMCIFYCRQLYTASITMPLISQHIYIQVNLLITST